MLDLVIDRREIKAMLGQVLTFMAPEPAPADSVSS